MLIEIHGSGGALPAPRPGCHCRTCDEAREKGIPYACSGPSTLIHGANILFDTSEESREQLNRSVGDRVDACFYSHWHPDHVTGRRVFEPLNWAIRGWPPRHRITDVYLPQQGAADFRTHLASSEHLAYMEQVGVVRVHEMRDGESVAVAGLRVTPFRLAVSYVYAFIVEEGETRVLIAPDGLVGWSPPGWLRGVDHAILSMGICEHDPLTGERIFPADHPVLREEMRFPEMLGVVRALRPRRAVLSHIEEGDDLGSEAFLGLAGWLREEGLPIAFAHDAMRIDVGVR